MARCKGWFSVFGFRFSVRKNLSAPLDAIAGRWPLKPDTSVDAHARGSKRPGKSGPTGARTWGASAVHCCQGRKIRARGAWERIIRGRSGVQPGQLLGQPAALLLAHLKDRSPGRGQQEKYAGPGDGSRISAGKNGVRRRGARQAAAPSPASPLHPSPQAGARAGRRGFPSPGPGPGDCRHGPGPRQRGPGPGPGLSARISATARARAWASGRRASPSFKCASARRARRGGRGAAWADSGQPGGSTPNPRPGPRPGAAKIPGAASSAFIRPRAGTAHHPVSVGRAHPTWLKQLLPRSGGQGKPILKTRQNPRRSWRLG